MTMVTASPTELNALAGMDGLRDRVQRNDPDAMREVAVQFEALVMNLMLKSARDAGSGEGLFDGPNTRQYLELMDQQVSLALARQGGLGVAKMLGADPEPVERLQILLPLAALEDLRCHDPHPPAMARCAARMLRRMAVAACGYVPRSSSRLRVADCNQKYR